MSVAAALVTGVSVLSVSSVSVVNADPAADALAKLEELSSQALKTREAVTAAQRDADTKLAEQLAADARQRADAEIPAIVAMPGQPSLAAARVDIPEAAALPVGVANEAGLQPNAILAARAVSQQFPQISEIGGGRPDSKPWHPSGLAIDIMIPNAGSPEGIALGDQIMAYALANAGRFGLQDVIWRGTYYTPAGPQASGYGHFDHVHLTVTRR
ncbi:NLP/P60 family protein [Mycolicibacterium neoaurum]|uniref:NLP/P60 family protein n=2 Tax=Mycolicibacterium neoaurum TaxID=1795 RepID=A0AAV2WDJ5_MYCNE|nr:NLP/P60 family protein [Mycolicibacterium neoaurum]